ncbi:SOS response-associated peptidase family protein [Streptomyces sp. NBC_01230]|uniref:SOS response-associated peptidase family protein n=2 Tax=unclassified Streptomyces TaxID=2593676 RepID=UPI002E133199
MRLLKGAGCMGPCAARGAPQVGVGRKAVGGNAQGRGPGTGPVGVGLLLCACLTGPWREVNWFSEGGWCLREARHTRSKPRRRDRGHQPLFSRNESIPWQSGGIYGRYASTRSPQDLTRLFQAADRLPDEELEPSWNVASTNDVYAILERAGREGGDEVRRELRPPRWGLVPSWAKEPKIGARMVNAQVETVRPD